MTRAALSPTELLELAREVLSVCSDSSLQDIIKDLEITGSSESTINRIFDGQTSLASFAPLQFLKQEGTAPLLPNLTTDSKDDICLVSSSDDDDNNHPSRTAFRSFSLSSYSQQKADASNDNDSGILPPRISKKLLASFSSDTAPPLDTCGRSNRASQDFGSIKSNEWDTEEDQAAGSDSRDLSTGPYTRVKSSSPSPPPRIRSRTASASLKTVISRHSENPETSIVVERFPSSRSSTAATALAFTQDAPAADDPTFSDWDYSLVTSPVRGRKRLTVSSSIVSQEESSFRSKSPEDVLSDSDMGRGQTYDFLSHNPHRGSPDAADLLPHALTKLSSFNSSTQSITRKPVPVILHDDSDDLDIPDELNPHKKKDATDGMSHGQHRDHDRLSWGSSMERSLSPPTIVRCDTDSETERMMEDVFSGNKNRQKKTSTGLSRSNSKSNLSNGKRISKPSNKALGELDDWEDELYGSHSQMSIEEEVTQRAGQRRKRSAKKTRSESDSDDNDAGRNKTASRGQKKAKVIDPQRQEEMTRRREEKARRIQEAKDRKELKLQETLAEKKANRDLKIANRLTTKSDSVKEMVVSVEHTMHTSAIGKAMQDYWAALECTAIAIRAIESETAIPKSALGRIDGMPRESCPLRHMVFWRRSSRRRYNEEQDMFFLAKENQIDLEPFCLLYLTAKEFALQIELGRLRSNLETVKRDMTARRDRDIQRKARLSQESLYEDSRKQRVIYLINGIEPYLRSLKNNGNRSYMQLVQAQLDPERRFPSNSAGTSKRNRVNEEEELAVSRTRIEQELLWLQLEQECFIIHSYDDEDAAQAIVSLTEQIGLAPYKSQGQKNDLNICADGVKSGTDSADIWVRALQQIHMVTHVAAKAIASHYPCIRSLYEGYRECSSIAEAQQMLEGIKIVGRTQVIGKALSKRIYDVFMTEDPNTPVKNVAEAYSSQDQKRMAALISFDANSQDLHNLQSTLYNMPVEAIQSTANDALKSASRPLRDFVTNYLTVTIYSVLEDTTYSVVYEHMSACFGSFLSIYTSQDAQWLTGLLKTLSDNLFYTAVDADKENPRAKELKVSDAAAKNLSKAINIVLSDKIPNALQDSKKNALYYLANLTMRIYFKIKSTRLIPTLLTNISKTGVSLTEYPMSQQVTQHYYLGRYRLYQMDLRRAEEHLSFAFRNCNYGSQDPQENATIYHNSRLTLIYLVACRLCQGRMPSQHLLRQYDLEQYFTPLMQAVKVGNLALLGQVLDSADLVGWFIQQEIYFLLKEKLMVLAWRSLIRRTCLISHKLSNAPNLRVRLHDLANVVQALTKEDYDLCDIECITTSLLDQGYIKGYIHATKKVLVLGKKDPFPQPYTTATLQDS
ncbi:hypothetical protein BG004_005856 [Podila humilis]|nr:hypothetical protein BG004_005856 [Podila humilis]